MSHRPDSDPNARFRPPDEDTDPGTLPEAAYLHRRADDDADHRAFSIRLANVERDARDAKRNREDVTRDWKEMLISFGELKAQLANLKGQMAGYLLAGMLLASVVGVLAAKVIH